MVRVILSEQSHFFLWKHFWNLFEMISQLSAITHKNASIQDLYYIPLVHIRAAHKH